MSSTWRTRRSSPWTSTAVVTAAGVPGDLLGAGQRRDNGEDVRHDRLDGQVAQRQRQQAGLDARHVVGGLADRLARTVPQYADKPFHRVLVCRVVAMTGWAASENA